MSYTFAINSTQFVVSKNIFLAFWIMFLRAVVAEIGLLVIYEGRMAAILNFSVRPRSTDLHSTKVYRIRERGMVTCGGLRINPPTAASPGVQVGRSVLEVFQLPYHSAVDHRSLYSSLQSITVQFYYLQMHWFFLYVYTYIDAYLDNAKQLCCVWLLIR